MNCTPERGGKKKIPFEKMNCPPKVSKKLDEMSIEELKARVAYLEAENDFLKKLKALGMGINPV